MRQRLLRHRNKFIQRMYRVPGKRDMQRWKRVNVCLCQGLLQKRLFVRGMPVGQHDIRNRGDVKIRML